MSWCCSCIFTAVGVLLLATSSAEAYSTLPANPACFATRPGTADNSKTTIKLGVRNWLSHQVSSALVEIALKEYLGYTISLIDLSSANAADWAKDLSNGDYHIDVESIYGASTDAGYAQYVGATSPTVNVLGSPGYQRRKGLFTTPGVVNSDPLATWYKYYKNAASVAGAGFKMYSTAESSNLQAAVGASWPLCTYSWCGTGAMAGFWVPSVCSSAPTGCALALMDTPGTGASVARYEQMASTHSMRLVYAYLGTALESKVKEIANAGDNVIFSWFMPDGLPVALNAKRIAFPDYWLGCVDSTSQTPSGTTGCDFADADLYKLTAQTVRNTAPEAYLLVREFQMYLNELEMVIKDTTKGGGAMTPHAAACKYLTVNNATVSGWVPNCVINPPVTKQTGDYIFNAFTLSCQLVLIYPEIDIPVCYSESEKPLKVNRSEHLLKGCYQYWLSHQIISTVGLIILRDFLGYSVKEVDLSASSTAVIWENMEGAACDLELESWQAGKTNPKYIDAVITRRVLLNPGGIGFDGRSSHYITPDAVTNHDMASYWKFYKTGQDLTNVKILHYGQFGQATGPPSMQSANTAFPSCKASTSWCPTNNQSAFYGYWVPPQCSSTPNNCVIAVHPYSTWDTAFFETITNNLQLQIIYTYYGPATTTIVKEIAKNKTTNVLFYWWEPDPFVTSTGAIRVSYPDYTWGCTANNKANPYTGNLTCDYPGTPLQKLTRASVSTQTPQAYTFVKNMLVSTPMVRDMMSLHVEGNGNLSTKYLVACAWVKANQAMIEAQWAQKCLVDPPATISIGTSVYDNAKQECVTITCAADQVILAGSSDCFTCGAGLMPNQARTECTPCQPGFVPNRTQTNYSERCTSCSTGYYCAFGAEEALKCAKGTYRDSTQNPLECVDCPRGKYQKDEGQSKCLQCPNTMTTAVMGAKLATSCICPAGLYKPKNATDVNGLVADLSIAICKSCPDGMVCAEGSDAFNIPCSNGQKTSIAPAGTYPVPELGNYVNCENPLSCFGCLSEAACPGGGVEECIEGMVGIACGRCVDNWYKSGDTCMKCNDVETSQLIFPALPLVAAPIGIAIFYKFSQDTITKWNSPANSVAAATFVTLIYIQTVAAISTCYIKKPKVVEDNTDWTQVTYDLLSLLRPGCTTFTDFKLSFVGKLLLPIYAIILFLFDFCVSRVVGLFIPKLKMDFDMTMNCYMAVFNTFFIGIAQQTFTLFQCYKHPNGEKSLRSQADILCDSDDWNSLVVVAVVAVILFCGGFMCLNVYICVVAPTRFGEPRFRKRWKFLFIKFRPSAWWWGMVLLVKGIWVNLPTVVFDYGAAQILWLQGAILSYLVCVFAISPWRTFIVACLDIIMHASLIFLFGFVTHFVDMGESSSNQLGTAYSFFVYLPVALGAGGILFFFYQRLIPPKHDWQGAAEEAASAFSQIAGQRERLARILPYLPFADIVALNRAKQLIQVEIGQDRKPKTMTDHMLLSMTQRSRLMVDFDNGEKSLSNLAISEPTGGKESDNSTKPASSSVTSAVHEQISKMRKIVKPDEIWLCSALEMAVSGQDYDVDALRGVYGNQVPSKSQDTDLDDINIPQENMLHEHLMHGMVTALSPRVVPPQGIGTPRSPRSMISPAGTPIGTPRGPLLSPRAMGDNLEHDIPKSPRGGN